MTKYICKCGRVVAKSTNADTTGNRDTENCKGCPYLLPWGPFEHVPGQGFVRNVQGYECRMSKDIEYATRFCGSIDDKCSCYIASLDFDFLTRVSNWIKETYPGGELNGSFFTDDIRSVEYSSNGRYRMSIGCAQNKKGIAAKAALLHQFFDASGARLDMTPEEEKAHILAAIEAGKAKASGKEKDMQVYTNQYGTLFAVREHNGSPALMCKAKESEQWVMSGVLAAVKDDAKTIGELQAVLDKAAQKYNWEPVENVPVENPTDAAEDVQQCAPTASNAPLSQSQSVNADAQQGGGDDAANPTYSAVATAVTEGTVATPEPLDSASMTAAPVAKTSEPTGVAPENILAGADGLTAFDYSGLDDQTVADLHLAEREYSSGKKMTEMGLRRMAEAVAIAHEALCGGVVHHVDNSKHGNRGEDSFRRWCEFIGVGKTTAYKMLQVAKLIDESTPQEKKVLEKLPTSLLYDTANPNTSAEAVQAVKKGGIATRKQLQELEAQLKAVQTERDEAWKAKEKAEQERDAARDAQAASSRLTNMITNQRDEAQIRAERAELRAKAAEEDAAGWKQAGLEMQELVDQRDERIRELESGITVEAAAVDQEEIERRANEISAPLEEIIRQQQETIRNMRQGADLAITVQGMVGTLNTLLRPLLYEVERSEMTAELSGALYELEEVLNAYARRCRWDDEEEDEEDDG